MSFDSWIREINEKGWEVHGVQVAEYGRILHTWGDTERTRYPIYSATKAITSLAAGIAADEGRLDLDASILRYLPEDDTTVMSDAQRETYRSISVRRLMTMSVQGYPFRPDGENWLRDSFRVPIKEPGKRVFSYSNIPAYLVGVTVSCAVGADLADYLDLRLFQPLRILKPPCRRSPEGWFDGASGLELTVNELGRIGLLLLNEGEYEGRRLVSAHYVREAVCVQQMNREGGYGYFIWKYRDGFSLNGKWGQKCYVLPRRGLIITFLANLPEGSDRIRGSMERNLLD